MSLEAITWALRQPIKHSSAKFVLVVLANCAGAEKAHAWPSVAYLCASTGQDRKTVMANLQRLQEWGMIEDTGKRVGDTKQIVVYKLICGPDLFTPPEEDGNSPKNGTVPKTEQSQKRNSPEKAPEQSRFSREESQKRDTEPSITLKNQKTIAQRFALRFNEFWAEYPRRVAKEPCRNKWREKDLDAKADMILADVRRRRAEDKRWDEGFIPDPLKYLSQERWDDDITPKVETADSPAPAPSQPPPAAKRDHRQNSESWLDNELSYIAMQYRLGAYGEGPESAAERDRLIAAARADARARPTISQETNDA